MTVPPRNNTSASNVPATEGYGKTVPLREGVVQKGGQNLNPAADFVSRPAPPVGSSGQAPSGSGTTSDTKAAQDR